MGSIQILRSSIATVLALIFFQLTAMSGVHAQTDNATAHSLSVHEFVEIDGERSLLALPVRPGIWQVSRPTSSTMLLETFESESSRRYVVTLEGKTYRASTPLHGTRSRIAFDPLRKRFIGLLPSIRVDLNENVDVEVLAETVDALRVTTFRELGFHIIELPEDVHPVDAIKAIQRLDSKPKATVRTRGMKLEWR